jgi:hypothetical protein
VFKQVARIERQRNSGSAARLPRISFHSIRATRLALANDAAGPLPTALRAVTLAGFAGEDKELPRCLRLRALVRRLVGDASFGEGRHAGVAGERGAENQQRRGGAGGFAEP